MSGYVQLSPGRPLVSVSFREARGRWSRRLTDGDLARLRPHLEALPQLDELDLTRADITDEGLMELRGLTHLKMLSVGDGYGPNSPPGPFHSPTRLTESGVNQIRKALPNAKVHFSRAINFAPFSRGG